MLSLEIVLYVFWYKELYIMQFFVLLGLCHFANTSIFFGIMTEILPKEKRKMIKNLSFIVFGFFFLMLYFNSSRIQNQIDQNGILINGIVEKKEYGSQSTRWLESKFHHNGIEYKSTFHMKIKEFKRVKIKDTVLIKFINEHPKLNRTVELLKK